MRSAGDYSRRAAAEREWQRNTSVMPRIPLLIFLLFSVSARAHGPGGAEFIVAAFLWFTLLLCIITVPVAMFLPNRPKGHRVGIGVCVPLASVFAGLVAGAILPGVWGWVFLGIPLLAVAGLACYVVAERSQANTPWPFHEATNFGVSCSRAILETGKPIAIVARHDDGSWRFLDGEAVRPGDKPADVCLEEIYRLDPTIAEVADLALGWRAERSGPTTPWSRAKIQA